MEFYDYLLYVVIWTVGAVYGWYARERHAERKLDRFLSTLEHVVDEKISETMVPIHIEKTNGDWYYAKMIVAHTYQDKNILRLLLESMHQTHDDC